jgi:hypothetical protein
MAPFPQNDHSLLPSERADRIYMDYGPLVEAMRGRKGASNADAPAPSDTDRTTTGGQDSLWISLVWKLESPRFIGAVHAQLSALHRDGHLCWKLLRHIAADIG